MLIPLPLAWGFSYTGYMKIQSPISLASLCLVILSISAPAQERSEAEANFSRADYLKFYTEEGGVVFTDWASNAVSHMYWKEMTELGMIPVRNEGRLRDGNSEFRKGFRNPKRAGEKVPKISWYCYTGLSQTRFDSKSDELFLKGFFLISIQSFQDAEGEQRYQALWVKPNGKIQAAEVAGSSPKAESREADMDALRKSLMESLKEKRKNFQNIDVPPGDPSSPAEPSADLIKG